MSATCSAAAAATRSSVEVEVVLEGRIPLGGGGWVEQYARSLADPDRPTAVLRFDDATASLSVVGPVSGSTGSAAVPPGAPAGACPPGAPTGGVGAALGELLARRSAPDRVLLHLTDAEAEIAPPILRAARRWTLLTAADQVSVASAFRIAKCAVQAAGADALPRIGVVVVGADPGPASGAAGMLNVIVQPLIGRRVELVGIQRRAYPLDVKRLAAAPAELTCWDACRDALAASLRDPGPTILSGRLNRWLGGQRPAVARPAVGASARVA